VKAKGQTSIGIVVSFGKLSEKGYKIVELRTDFSTVTVTTLASITRAGMKYIPSQDLIKMCESSGTKATEAKKEIGDDGTNERKKSKQESRKDEKT
jgi:hypothetical protein